MNDSILTADDRALLAAHGAELLELEQRYGSQRGALEARPELAATGRALQVARAQMAAEAMGLKLRGDGRPLPPDLLSELQLVFSRLSTEDDADAAAGISTPSGLARFLDQHAVDDRAE